MCRIVQSNKIYFIQNSDSAIHLKVLLVGGLLQRVGTSQERFLYNETHVSKKTTLKAAFFWFTKKLE